MDSCRLLIESEPGGGSWNMAVDEVLLQSAIERRVATLRFYSWSEATLSLGYFQDAGSVRDDPRLAGLPAVRRLSGGGAILHDREITYSCALPADHRLAAEPLELYRRVHQAIIAVLNTLGVPVRLREESRPGRDPTFLCFGRGDPRDVILLGHKILGSAQRRRRGAVLQHGSLLLAGSPHAPEFPGIGELAPGFARPAAFAEALANSVAPVLATTATVGRLSEDERDAAERLKLSHYSSLDWGGSRAGRPA